MTQQFAGDGAENRFEASEIGGTWFIRRVDTQFWGQGKSLAEAQEALRRRETEYHAFLEQAGIPIIPVTGLKRWIHRAARPAGRLLAALAVFSLFMVPVSYAISSGIWRGVKQTEIKVGGREFWTGLERRIIEYSKEPYDLPPEQVLALREAIHRIVLRLRPFTSEIKQILDPVDNAPAPEKK